MKRGKPLKRSPLRRSGGRLARSGGLSRATRVNPISDKTVARNAEYMAAREIYMRAHPTCEYPGCRKPSTDCQHVERRTASPDRVTDPTNFAALCAWHHTLVTNDPEHGKEVGLVKSSTYELRNQVVNTKEP